MKTIRLMTRVLRIRKARSLAADNRGVSAVEFALIAPLIVLMFFATVELSQGVAASRKLTLTVRALSDLVAQATAVTTTDLNNVFAAASAIMTPFPTNVLQAKISAVNIDASGIAKIDWSKASSGTSSRSKNDVVTNSIPAALRVPDTQLIWSEVSYTFTPPTSYFLVGNVYMSDQFFARPRQSNTVTGPTS